MPVLTREFSWQNEGEKDFEWGVGERELQRSICAGKQS